VDSASIGELLLRIASLDSPVPDDLSENLSEALLWHALMLEEVASYSLQPIYW
jgi:hypothetical protein